MNNSSTYLWPSAEQLDELTALNLEGPVSMLNLLRFKSEGGRETYRRYGAAATPFLKKNGGNVKFWGLGAATVIGGENWDEIILVEYPSVRAFLTMIQDPDYPRQIRSDALLDSRLYCTQSPG